MELEQIFREALTRCAPDKLVLSHLEPIQGKLWLFGAGKAAVLMAKGVSEKYGNQVQGGVIIVPEGYPTGGSLGPVEVLEGTHPHPTEKSAIATQRLLEVAALVPKDESVIFVLSGGASALLVAPSNGITLEEKSQLIARLMKAGAPIAELNIVRKHLSRVKGGRLAGMFKNHVTVLVLSDVAGNSFSTIGSGPFSVDESTRADALGILKKWRADGQLTADMLTESSKTIAGARHVLVGDGLVAARAAANAAEAAGLPAVLILEPVQDPVEAVAESYAALVRSKVAGESKVWVRFGEPTLEIGAERPGKGGRCQHLVLEVAKRLQGLAGWRFLAAGTDGVDGPTESAGGVVDGRIWERAVATGLEPQAALVGFNAGPVLESLGALVCTGPTGNNLQDLHLLQVGDF